MGPFDVDRDFSAPAVEPGGWSERGGLAILIDLGEARRIGQTEGLIEDMQCALSKLGSVEFTKLGLSYASTSAMVWPAPSPLIPEKLTWLRP